MIEPLVSKTGQKIFVKNGRRLCSHIDPIREANQWVEALNLRPSWSGAFLVLGLGCGYHLLVLRKRFPNCKFLVVEPCRSTVDWNLQTHNVELGGVDIISPQTPSDFEKHPQARETLKGLYKVLSHAPSEQLQPQLFAAIREFSLGRWEGGFRYAIEVRSDLRQLFGTISMASQLRVVQPNEAVSIKTLSRMLPEDYPPAAGRPYFILKALNELVR